MGSTESTREDPRIVYARRRELRRARAAARARQELWIANARLATFVAAAVLAWLAFVSRIATPFWIALPAAGYLGLVILHDRVIRIRRRAEHGARFYERGLARLDHEWIGSGKNGERFLDRSHPYAEDLDLFGPGSLFELLCTAETGWGEESLADCLCSPPEPRVIRRRQRAVGELRSRLDLREELAVLGSEVRAGSDPETLVTWCRARSAPASRLPLLLGRIVLLLAVAGAAGWAFLGIGPAPLLGAAALQWILSLAVQRRAGRIARDAERPGGDLALLARVLGRLEQESFATPLLSQLLASLQTDGIPPSRRIAQLGRLLEMQEWGRNAFFTPIALLLNWNAELARAIDRWRSRHSPAVPGWLTAVGEIEALGSLGGFAYEHPDDPFPEIVEPGPCFEAEALGHPLIPESRCVRNDLRLDGETRMLIVSGSNMSGKSTLLRAVGTNTVLALAGAPVRAGKLALSPLAIGASIRSHDSLHDGTSRFYEEIKRLRDLVEIAEGLRTLLFLIDEILHGTNSHDRGIGAEAVARGLVERGGIGLITTHDLALTRIAEDPTLRAANIHFEDRLERGRIVFDYRVRPGVVARSNALALMRAIGLRV